MTAIDAPQSSPSSPMPRVKLALIVLLTVVMAVLVIAQVSGVNGPWYWKWEWRRVAWWTYAAMLPPLGLFAIAQWLYVRGRIRAALGMLFVTTLTLQFAALAAQPGGGVKRLLLLVQSPRVTSYWIDASVLAAQPDLGASGILAGYDEITPMLHVHARFKPPGPLLNYWFWLKVTGGSLSGSAWAGGICIAMIAALSGPGCYWFLQVYGRDRNAAFCGASFLALCPSLILFLPQFDQVYVPLTCAILVMWAKASRDANFLAAVACGALLALGLFLSYIFLTLGCFIVVYWLLILLDRGADRFWRAAMNGAIAMATVAAIYGLLWAGTGFDPIATWRAIAREQANDLVRLARPFPAHMLFDVLDFAMASGWIGFLLVVFFLARTGRRIFIDRSPAYRLALVSLVHIAAVACTALLPGEAARLWMLMLPMLMAPIGIELAAWPMRARMVVYVCLWLMVAVIGQNMILLNLGPDIDVVMR
jgi:hypothetical protein